MNNFFIKKFIYIFILIILTACNSNSIVQSDEKIKDNTVDVSSFVINTESETTVNTIIETSISDEYKPKLDLTAYSFETQQYMNNLIVNKTFQSLYNEYEYAQVIDLNNDSVPEVIIQCSPYADYETHYSYVFRKDENNVVAILTNDYEYTYYGSTVKAYTDKNGYNVFISDVLFGGVGTGEFGKRVIEFDGKNINVKNIFRCNWEGNKNTIQYQYFDGEFTTEEYNIEYDDYMASLIESKQYSETTTLQDESYMQYEPEKSNIIIAELLDRFYEGSEK